MANTARILCCDDSITNISMLEHMLLEAGYVNVETTTDPREIAPRFSEREYDLLLLDLEMPHLNGFDIITLIRSSKQKVITPILMLTGSTKSEDRNKALSIGANDFVNKPFDQTEVLLRVKNLLFIRESLLMKDRMNIELERKVRERTMQLTRSSRQLIQKLAMAGEYRDNATGMHVERVGKFSRVLAEACNMPTELCEAIEMAAPMHDIGKIGVPDHILLKPGELAPDEFNVMKDHVQLGAELLEDDSTLLMQMCKSIAQNHHEKWDGTGYPAGLSGETIPMEGRIVALADVFDALTSERPYKHAWSIEEAVTYIRENSGTHFDPRLVVALNDNLDRFIQIKSNFPD